MKQPISAHYHYGVMTLVVLGFALALMGCGSEIAQSGDVVVAPADTLAPIDGGRLLASFQGGDATPIQLVFKVQDPKNANAPVPQVEVEFFASAGFLVVPSPALMLRPRITNQAGTCLNPNACERYKAKTDNAGKIIVHFTINLPAANATTDITVNGEITAFTTASQATWKGTFIVKKPI